MGDSPPTRKKRVMVLEDDALVRQAWVEALEADGYVVTGSAAGADLLARLSEIDPDVIVLDMLMPSMDGFEFLARLRAHPRGTDIPVLIVSAMAASLAEAIASRDAGTLRIAGILSKSIELPTLLDHVRWITNQAPEDPA